MLIKAVGSRSPTVHFFRADSWSSKKYHDTVMLSMFGGNKKVISCRFLSAPLSNVFQGVLQTSDTLNFEDCMLQESTPCTNFSCQQPLTWNENCVFIRLATLAQGFLASRNQNIAHEMFNV